MKKKSGFWTEFRQFIAKGNVMNLAVGVIIGAAFQAITTSLVNDIIFSGHRPVCQCRYERLVGRRRRRGNSLRRFFDSSNQFFNYGAGDFSAGQATESGYDHQKKAGTASSAHCQKMSVLLQRNPAGSDPLPALHL